MRTILALSILWAALGITGSALAQDPMSKTDWIKMLKKCVDEAQEINTKAQKVHDLTGSLDDAIKRKKVRGQAVDVSDEVDELKDARRELTTAIKQYQRCRKGWRLTDTVQF